MTNGNDKKKKPIIFERCDHGSENLFQMIISSCVIVTLAALNVECCYPQLFYSYFLFFIYIKKIKKLTDTGYIYLLNRQPVACSFS
jgi:hypothetical protein